CSIPRSSSRSPQRPGPRSTPCSPGCSPASSRSALPRHPRPRHIPEMRASLPSLAHVADFLDATLRIGEIPDYPNALNGVQVANETGIVRVACAVDFSTGAVEGAIDARANLLIVHHGMFWGGAEPLTGQRHRRLR